MNELETKIYEVIGRNNGITGAAIAKILGTEAKVVNSSLYKSDTLKALVYQTQDYKWRVIGKKLNPGQKAPEPDAQLSALCKYYLECISLESSNNVSQFLTSNFALNYAVLSRLGIDPVADEDAIELLHRINGNKTLVAYLGYPICIYSFARRNEQFRRIAPVFLFPVDYHGGKITIDWNPKINMEIINRFSWNSGDSPAMELVNLQTELGMNDLDYTPSVEELSMRLMSIRQWDWKEPIDPYSISAKEDLSSLPDGFYNKPIVICAERSNYTHGLEKELAVLSKMPEENYKGTALYAWIKHGVQALKKEHKPVLGVLPLNSEQEQAVETGLASYLSVITGPPGTGKSQVVTDLLINIAWNGNSVLFSSKNNKAVDVVETRINSLCERPFLLRLGATAMGTSLPLVAKSLLDANGSNQDTTALSGLMTEYESDINEIASLTAQKNEVVCLRNALDSAERKYCDVRDEIPFEQIPDDKSVPQALASAVDAMETAAIEASKEQQRGLSKLFWPFLKRKRAACFIRTVEDYNRIATKYDVPKTSFEADLNEIKTAAKETRTFLNKLAIAEEYKAAFSKLKSREPLEKIDKKLIAYKAKQAQKARELWEEWLMTRTITLSGKERGVLADYIAEAKLMEGATDKKKHANAIKTITRFFSCWAITSLSVDGRVPLLPAMFDYVVVDEASQCDIASMIPLLYRASQVIVIGDPKQLNHISLVSKQQDAALISKYQIPAAWAYSVNSLYDLAEGKVDSENKVSLKDHFRSCEEIIGFSNRFFYDGSLRTATKYENLIIPAGEKPGIRWLDVKGEIVRPKDGSAYNDAEEEAIISELERLIDSGYSGTIGVITPFREQAKRIKDVLEKENPELHRILRNKHCFDANTVHAFQGDERDLVLFSLVVTKKTPASTIGFLASTGNLFNVAITRARSTLIVIGDNSYCSICDVEYLRKFAEYYAGKSDKNNSRSFESEYDLSREYPAVSNPHNVSEWEKILYTALFDAGIKTMPQYPVDKYDLDLALIQGGRKLDIEVDGESYHRSWNGELCYRDQLRNQRLYELGWDVKRFWVYQIRDDLNTCVKEIAKWCIDGK